ncbi:hypothetical protein GCM10010168_82980 [Actinoplanes ianthinogenes]|uniref:caspase, EACC1-associated type n=1 Tax=Actinoplanes ianthinogenes TaxID=122358 RepID=UPI00166F6D0C|nr:caspase family protein [Actinoplanes ianthinogenes]GGR51525.1 hypothetical protein GCM10010168_82980 [Actinoplanes ianthinogenes]
MGRRLALLVAAYDYADEGLRRLTAPGHDAEALAAVLSDPEIAGFEVTTLINEPHHRVGAAIGELCRDRRRDDLTLLYFTGHGLKDDDGRLYLATSDTRRDTLLFSAISAEQIDRALEGCASRRKVLILDCCYSGAFPAGRLAKADEGVHTLERFQGRGRTVLTASDATQYSFEGDRARGSAVQSVFTRYLVEGLRDGSADLDGDGDITLDELYAYVHDRVVAEIPQQRPKKQDDVEGRIVIARNVGWRLPEYLRHAIDSPIAADRLAVISQLARLHRVGNSTVRDRVREEIEQLAQDDSKRVSAAAAERLREFAPTDPEPAPPPRAAPEPAPTAAPDIPPPPAAPEPAPPVSEPALTGAEPALTGTEPALTGTEPALTGTEPAPPAAPEPRPVPQAAPEPAPAPPSPTETPWFRRWQVIAAAAAVVVAATAFLVVRLVDRDHDSASSSGGSAAAPYDITPPGLAISPDGRRLYVTVNRQTYGTGKPPTGRLVSVDTQTRLADGTMDITPGAGDAAISADGNRLYVVSRYQSGVAVINKLGAHPAGISGFELPGAGSGTANRAVALAPDGKHLFVADDSGNRVWSADVTKNPAKPSIQSYPTTFATRLVAPSPDSKYLYLAGGPPAAGARFDLGAGRQEESFPVGTGPRDLVVSRDGKHVYLAAYGTNQIDVGNTGAPGVARSFNPQCGMHPQALAVSADGTRLYTACESSNVVSVSDAATGTTIGRPITVGTLPSSMVLSPDGRRLYVSTIDGYDIKIAVVDTTTGAAIDTAINLGSWLVS